MPNIENLTHLPHIKNVKAGIGKQDPVHGSLFEVYIELPSLIASMFKEDAVTLTQQVKSVGGINALQMTTGVGSQRFLGADASYLNPVLDQTFADIDIAFNPKFLNDALRVIDDEEITIYMIISTMRMYP